MSWTWKLANTKGYNGWGNPKRAGFYHLIGQVVYLSQISRSGKIVHAGYMHDNEHSKIDLSNAMGAYHHAYATVKYADGSYKTAHISNWKSIDLRVKEARGDLAVLEPLLKAGRDIKA